jgi:hypothetical protein
VPVTTLDRGFNGLGDLTFSEHCQLWHRGKPSWLTVIATIGGKSIQGRTEVVIGEIKVRQADDISPDVHNIPYESAISNPVVRARRRETRISAVFPSN